MQAIVLAAGLGSRLGDLTESLPKALIEVAGRPLIHYALRFARRVGITDAVVVGGYGYEDVRRFVAADDPEARVVDNEQFRKGNLISLRAGLAAIDPSAGFLVMNTDHIYRPAIADVVRAAIDAADELTGFCDFDRELGADDMKVRLDGDRRIREIDKKLATWDAGYVGMTYVPAARAADYVDAIPGLLSRQGDAIHVERILAHMATTERPPAIADISGHGWLEIDEPHERAHAEATLDAQRWWR